MVSEIEDYNDVSRMLRLKAAALLGQGRYDDAEKLKLMLKLLDSYMWIAFFCSPELLRRSERPTIVLRGDVVKLAPPSSRDYAARLEPAPPPPEAPPPPRDDAARELTTDEERVAKVIIDSFPRGVLDCRRGTTIEAYLAEKLHLEPAHVTELFDGDLSIEFVPCKTENIEFARAFQALLVHRFPSHFQDASVAYAASAASPARADAVSPSAADSVVPAPASSSTPASAATAAPAPAADETWLFNCRCGDKGWGFDDGSAMWQCEKCESWQHERCMSIGGGGVPSPYFCDECAPAAAPKCVLARAAAAPREPAEFEFDGDRVQTDFDSEAEFEFDGDRVQTDFDGEAEFEFDGDRVQTDFDGEAEFEFDGDRVQTDFDGEAEFEFDGDDGAVPLHGQPLVVDGRGTGLDRLRSLGAGKISRLEANGIDTVEKLAVVDIRDYPLVRLITGNQRPDKASTTIAKWRDIALTFLGDDGQALGSTQ
ncbi:hypothetical protein AURANDRAFT_68343 [Aureococcus anophagefferens]|uniref:Zinc finger PHD-type domain-containing protein n=1 Tax=Aureococcus anophagefferens TaxID=44056 RepID=F0YPA9_AURAN|nr:hypothetical protein AURANDRAFT_68343 [Aureococcus anophagefferens]EGB03051.1 hypothetical protein AURANDRAFT_68343 [Aureococcus anophagefferens]|eukprot:XP_009042250.1 hypothetical protein AURANDRAFT_68343 [Aureococcus anophagefferens]